MVNLNPFASPKMTRIVPPEIPKVGQEIPVPTGPESSVTAKIEAVTSDGIIILKMPDGTPLVGYYAKMELPEGVERLTRDGEKATVNEAWMLCRIHP